MTRRDKLTSLFFLALMALVAIIQVADNAAVRVGGGG